MQPIHTEDNSDSAEIWNINGQNSALNRNANANYGTKYSPVEMLAAT